MLLPALLACGAIASAAESSAPPGWGPSPTLDAPADYPAIGLGSVQEFEPIVPPLFAASRIDPAAPEQTAERRAFRRPARCDPHAHDPISARPPPR